MLITKVIRGFLIRLTALLMVLLNIAIPSAKRIAEPGIKALLTANWSDSSLSLTILETMFLMSDRQL